MSLCKFGTLTTILCCFMKPCWCYNVLCQWAVMHAGTSKSHRIFWSILKQCIFFMFFLCFGQHLPEEGGDSPPDGTGGVHSLLSVALLPTESRQTAARRISLFALTETDWLWGAGVHGDVDPDLSSLALCVKLWFVRLLLFFCFVFEHPQSLGLLSASGQKLIPTLDFWRGINL